MVEHLTAWCLMVNIGEQGSFHYCCLSGFLRSCCIILLLCCPLGEMSAIQFYDCDYSCKKISKLYTGIFIGISFKIFI